MPAIIQDVIELQISIQSDATAGQSYICPRAGVITDVRVLATATDAGGTVTVSTATGAATGALACAADQAVTRIATGLNAANTVLSAGEAITVTTNQAGTRGVVIVTLTCTPAFILTAV